MIKKAFIGLVILISNSLVAQFNFVDVASSVGADYAYGTSMYGGGVSFVDFDNDGWDDITISTDNTKKIHFLKNNGGTFAKIDLQGVNDQSMAKQILWVDYDNDGDKDLFITNVIGKNRFYRNDGSLEFTDITNSCGIFTDDLMTSGATFGDLDKDGDLDLFIVNWEHDDIPEKRNYLYRNDNGSFIDITESNGIDFFKELSLGATFLDYDNDGDQDIYMINDRYIYQNRMYQNDGTGNFTDVSLTSGTAIAINAMSIGVGDYNSDGLVDIYVTNSSEGNQLLHNNGNGTFTDVASSTNTQFNSFSWGAVFLDADNDSNLDLYVSGPFDGTVSSLLPSAFYHNDGDDTFTIHDNIGLDDDTLESHSNAIGDYNNDGKPDILVMNDKDDPVFLWSNTNSATNSWLKVKLEGVISNKDGIGNRIELRANGKSQYRFTVCGESYLGQNSLTEFFGLDSATNIEYIKVTWTATGQTDTITNVQPNQSITIQEGNGILSRQDDALLTLSVFPNPSESGVFTIQHQIMDTIEYSLFDVQGKLIEQKELINNQLNISTFASGIYFLKLNSESNTVVKKLIKQ